MNFFSKGHAVAVSVILMLPAIQHAAADDGLTTPATLRDRVVEQVVAGGYHTCARVVGGDVWCWGDNSAGQLGDGTNTSSNRAVRVAGLGGVTDLSAGFAFTCATTAAGPSYCWGDNAEGQLGDGTRRNRNTPTEVSGLPQAVQIAAGTGHACAVTAAGAAMCWGRNGNGELGDGTRRNRTSPVQVGGDLNTRVVQIGAGEFHSCAMRRNGSLACWGDNAYGQLGDENLGQSTTSPVNVALAQRAAQLSVGPYHSCALRGNGVAMCWGYNGYGAVGDATTVDRDTPTRVRRISDVADIAAGGFFGHSCAALGDGTASCWGFNASGQLGDGTRRTRIRPSVVSELDSIVQVATGRDHSCAVVADGQAYCWGNNFSGQLGDRSFRNRREPTRVR